MDALAQVLNQLPAIHQQLLLEAWQEWMIDSEPTNEAVTKACDELSEAFGQLAAVR